MQDNLESVSDSEFGHQSSLTMKGLANNVADEVITVITY